MCVTVSTNFMLIYKDMFNICIHDHMDAYTGSIHAVYLTDLVAHWLELLIVHIPKRSGGNIFKPLFILGSYWWNLGELSSRVYPTVSHLLIHLFESLHQWRGPLE